MSITPNTSLNLKTFLTMKGKELLKEDPDYVSDVSPESVVDQYYRENVSEGWGEYPVDALSRIGNVVKVEPEEKAWFEEEVGPLDDKFASTVYGLIVADAMQAMINDPKVALALTSAVDWKF